MTERIQKDELARRLAERMQTDVPTATAWIDGVVETLYESFQAGEGVTLKNFGSFYVRPERTTWAFKTRRSDCARCLAGLRCIGERRRGKTAPYQFTSIEL